MSSSLDKTFFALSDSTRRAMLKKLARGDVSVSNLAAPFIDEMSLPAISKHIKVLEDAGLIKKSKDAQFRICKLQNKALNEAYSWIEQYEKFWNESFDRLDEYLKTIDKKENKRGENVKKRKLK